jgi:hypothetical protein
MQHLRGENMIGVLNLSRVSFRVCSRIRDLASCGDPSAVARPRARPATTSM